MVKNYMKIIHIELTDDYLDLLENMTEGPCIFPSEETRVAVREMIREEFLSGNEENHQDFQLKLKERGCSPFYDYCINCDKRVYSELRHLKYKNRNIFELRFCCFCFEKFKGKTLEDLPDSIIEKINRKLSEFRKIKYK